MSTFVTELKKQHAAFMAKQQKQRVARRTELSPLRNDDFFYTDAPQYAEKYYGDTYRQTTKFDNDWD